jgi:antitoxin (DNA-binding transcriptional repressor) of toxin-antitoxin stability system
MQTFIRYTITNQDGRPVIRAVPVPRRIESPTAETRSPAPETKAERAEQPFVQRIRRFRLLDNR